MRKLIGISLLSIVTACSQVVEFPVDDLAAPNFSSGTGGAGGVGGESVTSAGGASGEGGSGASTSTASNVGGSGGVGGAGQGGAGASGGQGGMGASDGSGGSDATTGSGGSGGNGPECCYDSDCGQEEKCDDGVCVCDADPCDYCPDWKAVLCHIPPGNPCNMHEICVGQSAVQAHLAHGDLLGECPSNGCDYGCEEDCCDNDCGSGCYDGCDNDCNDDCDDNCDDDCNGGSCPWGHDW